MNNAQLAALRDLQSTSSYQFKLSFTREFTSGTLVGLTHDDSIGFCTRLDAEEWVSSISRQNAAGKLNYRVVKWSVR
jgi:hypothetical protein